MNPINFKANFIKTATIQKKNDNNYVPRDVSFVELDVNNKDDKNAIKDVSDHWGKSAVFAFALYLDMLSGDLDPEYDKNIHFYALTNQKTEFEKLRPQDILGVAEVNDKSTSETNLDFLQVNPKEINGSETKTYKHIGTAILDSLKDINKNKRITIFSVNSAIDFYKKNDFYNPQGREHDSHMVIDA